MERLQEILVRLELELNKEKSRAVDAERETFDFLGFTYRRVTNPRTGKRATVFYPSKKAQKRLREKVKNILNPSHPITLDEYVQRTNRAVRGWVNYFRIGNASRVFRNIRHHVEVKCGVFYNVKPDGMGADGVDMTMAICTTAWVFTRIIMFGGARSVSLSSHRKAV